MIFLKDTSLGVQEPVHPQMAKGSIVGLCTCSNSTVCLFLVIFLVTDRQIARPRNGNDLTRQILFVMSWILVGSWIYVLMPYIVFSLFFFSFFLFFFSELAASFFLDILSAKAQ